MFTYTLSFPLLHTKRMDALLVLALLFVSAAAAAQDVASQAAPAVLEVQVQKPVAKVSPTLYGLMTEEINYSYDGGLYAELIRNRAFEDENWMLAHWTLVQNKAAGASMYFERKNGPSAALQRSLKLVVERASATDPAGVQNEGFWGIPVRPRTIYKASFYARADNATVGPVTVKLVNDDTGNVLASGTAEPLTTEWKQYRLELKTGQVPTSAANHFRLTIERPGTVWFSLVSLFPPTYKNRENGNRVDLMEKLAAMKPKFLRFPGGNYLEGDHINERFDWKKTIGPLVDRPTHRSPWNYHSSDGMGLLEFLEWCEDLDMQPVVGVYAGYSLQQEHIEPGPALEPYVQDALDEIEYITGAPETKWGAVRAQNGHPQPFPLTYVEIGNEDQFDRSHTYDARFAQFFDAIKKKHPHLQIIGSTGVKSRTPDVIDNHYYRFQDEFYNDTHHYDKHDRKATKIFVGEWATMESTPTPNFGAALADAAWMTGLERNSDVVIMASYAPLFTNVNPSGLQWRTNLIGYDALVGYGSPSYWAQVMFSNHLGTEVVDSKLEGAGPRFFYSVTRDREKGVLFLKLVNASPDPQVLDLKLPGAEAVKGTAKLVTLQAKTKEATNTINNPANIVPVTTTIRGVGRTFRHTTPPYSIQVLEFQVK
jgi:alpha-N-arabinofuranosidase